MALETHVTDRFGSTSPFLRGLTNHDDPDASTVNSTRLGLAADAAEGQFPVYAQVTYDDTNQRHIEAGVTGVIAYLKAWSTGNVEPPEMVQFRTALEAIARISSRKRVDPVTTSVYTPSTPDTSRGAVRPRFDPEQFDGVRPSPPHGDPGTV